MSQINLKTHILLKPQMDFYRRAIGLCCRDGKVMWIEKRKAPGEGPLEIEKSWWSQLQPGGNMDYSVHQVPSYNFCWLQGGQDSTIP
ncbi:uncharacterized protein BDZ83DRAFT_617157 [Colletotrichum acutatum]|uniref:Uncharacterized protein n=1 Tax=Glomerella acutata TaxID=27357 RepID=A0AAD8UNN4_GLOAC|nr:uncharacterized protein BDZ83DRAFT_617157 [Colletotrichum acutatum]KAK1726097.1 hypothetical protein BDZ83DRAFT_617157 [Colletotrichum acutatum]